MLLSCVGHEGVRNILPLAVQIIVCYKCFHPARGADHKKVNLPSWEYTVFWKLKFYFARKIRTNINNTHKLMKLHYHRVPRSIGAPEAIGSLKYPLHCFVCCMEQYLNRAFSLPAKAFTSFSIKAVIATRQRRTSIHFLTIFVMADG